MFKKMALILTIGSSLLCCMAIFAQENPPPQIQTATTQAAPLKQYFCPSISELTKEGLFWKAGNSWKSFTQSFAKEIGGFLGAQWMGVNIGKIICLYHGKESIDFPIAIEQVHSQLILEPKGPNWSTPISGRRICKSSNIFDCAFTAQAEESSKDAYEDIKYQTESTQPQSELFRE